MKTALKVLIAVLVIAIIASIFILIFWKGKGTEVEVTPPPSSIYGEEDFQPDKYTSGTVAYDEIMTLDLAENYPGNPQLVAEQYSKIYSFVYGDYIANEDILKEMITRERAFYSKELLEANTEEEQYESLLVMLNDAKAAGYYFIDYEVQNVVYDEQVAALCQAEVLMYASTGRNVVINYLIERDPDSKKWLIQSWDMKMQDAGLTEE